MKYFVIALSMLLAGCVELDRYVDKLSGRDADGIIARYGESCERLGFEPRTKSFAECVINMDRNSAR